MIKTLTDFIHELRQAKKVLKFIGTSIDQQTRIVGCDGSLEDPSWYALYTHKYRLFHEMVARYDQSNRLVYDRNRVDSEVISRINTDFPGVKTLAADAVFEDGYVI